MASLWQLKEKAKKSSVYVCIPALHDSLQWKKTILLLLLAPSHPRHHLSSCHSTAARAVVFTPLCSLIQVHSPEVVWNIAYPPLCIA